jgi:hypothetical protein
MMSLIVTTAEVPTVTDGERLVIYNAEAKVIKDVIGDPVTA